jgi:1-acyl-sn-glycerol-3-phosphate acyltransferase
MAGIMPGADRRAKFAGVFAKLLMALTRSNVRVEGLENVVPDGPLIFVANRAGRLDALILATALPQPLRLADTGEVRFMPPEAATLVRHLVLEGVPGQTAPPGGTLRDRIRHALESGLSVLVLPESPAGSPTHRTRFRLDAFHAAILTGRPLVPVSVRGTSRALDRRQHRMRQQAIIRVGAPVLPGCSDGRELIELRERVREEIAKMSH